MKNKHQTNYQGKYYDPNYHQNKKKYGDKYDPRKFAVKNPNYRPRKKKNNSAPVLNLLTVLFAMIVLAIVYYDLDITNLLSRFDSPASIAANVADSKTTTDIADSVITTDPPALMANQLLTVSACDLEGSRVANAKVDIGYGDRQYFGYTNQYGQLAYVTAASIIPQYKSEEQANNRYCDGQANVDQAYDPYNRGHAIGDALGGVSNAYNIFPQLSSVNGGIYNDNEMSLNEVIDNGGSVTDFEMTFVYSSSSTNIPSSYSLSYKVNGVETTKQYNN